MTSPNTPGLVSVASPNPTRPWNFAMDQLSELRARGTAEGPLVLDVVVEEVARVRDGVEGEVRALVHAVRRAARGHRRVGVATPVGDAGGVDDRELRGVGVERRLGRG